MEALLAKVVALLCLFVSTVLFGTVPYKFVSAETSGRFTLVSLASCFSGGVFLGTCFLHLLPDVQESFDAVFQLYKEQTSYPVTGFVIVLGFFLVLIFEQIVLLFHQPGRSSKCKTANVPPHGCHKKNTCERCDDEKGLLNQNGGTDYGSLSVNEDVRTTGSGRNEIKETEMSASLTISPNHSHHSQSEHHALVGTLREKNSNWDQPSASFRSLLLLAALSMHSLFEGLAMGLQRTTSSVFEVFIAVLLHKCILAFSLGVRFVQSGSKLGGLIRAVLVFAIMSPIGVSIGIAVTETENKNTAARQLVTAILQGIATGTFLFVTFLEILAHELKEKRSPASKQQMLKLFMALLGYAAMAGLQFLDH